MLTLAFMISYGWGREMKAAKSLSAVETRKSLFRLGLDRTSQIFGNAERFRTEIQALLEWFIRPKYDSIFIV